MLWHKFVNGFDSTKMIYIQIYSLKRLAQFTFCNLHFVTYIL